MRRDKCPSGVLLLTERVARVGSVDSPRPTVPFKDYAYNEVRYRSLMQTRPDDAKQLLAAAQAGIHEKYRLYEEMAGWEPMHFGVPEPAQG